MLFPQCICCGESGTPSSLYLPTIEQSVWGTRVSCSYGHGPLTRYVKLSVAGKMFSAFLAHAQTTIYVSGKRPMAWTSCGNFTATSRLCISEGYVLEPGYWNGIVACEETLINHFVYRVVTGEWWFSGLWWRVFHCLGLMLRLQGRDGIYL